jgi:hypothetical protein
MEVSGAQSPSPHRFDLGAFPQKSAVGAKAIGGAENFFLWNL